MKDRNIESKDPLSLLDPFYKRYVHQYPNPVMSLFPGHPEDHNFLKIQQSSHLENIFFSIALTYLR